MTELQDAVAADDSTSVVQLIEGGFDANADDVNKGTAIYQALTKGNINMLSLLLGRAEIDVNAQIFENRYRALHFSVVVPETLRSEQAMGLLLGHPGIEVNAQNAEGQTALHYCAKYGKNRMALKIIQRQDFDPNVQDNNGRTVLMNAVEKENIQLVTQLLNHPLIDAKIKNGLQESALSLCRDLKNKKITVMIEDRVLEHLNTPIGLLYRGDRQLRVYCEKMFNLKLRTFEDIKEQRVDREWFSWKVGIKQDAEVEKAWALLQTLTEEAAVAVAEPVMSSSKDGVVPMAKVV